MYKLVIFFFFFIGCVSSSNLITTKPVDIAEIKLNVVEKQIFIHEDLPPELEKLLNYWFNEKVKVDGFEGKAIFNFSKYFEKIKDSENGKEILISLSLSIDLKNNLNIQNKKNYNFTVEEFSSIQGTFSLKDLDNLVLETHKNLVNRLSKKVQSSI